MAKKKFSNPSDGLNLVLFEPESDWTAPTSFPDLRGSKSIGVDLETRDPKLKTHGPGTFRKDGYPVGIALCVPPSGKVSTGSVEVVDRGWKAYYPFAHQGGGNLDRQAVLDYAKAQLESSEDKVGSNILYDAEWLRALGIRLGGAWQDTQIAEALLDEEADSFGLETLSRKYLGKGKNEELLELAAKTYGCDPKADLWKLPPKYVGPYAQIDPENSILVLEKQKSLLKAQGLWSIFEMETELSKLVLEMRFLGVRVDVEKAEKCSKMWDEDVKRLEYELFKEFGFWVNVNSGDHLNRLFENQNLEVGTTKTGRNSYDKLFFKHCKHPTALKVAKIRRMRKLKSDFCDKLILDYSVNGRIHATFNQMPRDDEDGEREGARSSRFSCTRPNLQQVPSRDPDMAPIIRGFFIPEKGMRWGKYDYSQQEPRIMVHYAFKSGYRGADKAREAWMNNRKADYYQLVADEANLKRKPAKDLTLGRCYGEGIAKIANDLGVDVEEAKRIAHTFDTANPYIKELSDAVMKVAQNRGYIKTLMGRHRHFNLYEPADSYMMRQQGKDTTPYTYEIAKKKYPGLPLKRAYAYKALNALIQGSAADMTKAAMLKVWKELGLVPHMQVHDELNYSIPNEEVGEQIRLCMESCVEISTPMLAEMEIGGTWK